MSSYLNIYIRKPNTKICTYLAGYSRSNAIYETFYETLGNNIENWETCKCLPVSKSDLNYWKSQVAEEIKSYHISQKQTLEAMEFLKTLSVSVEDIMLQYREYQERLTYYQESLEELQFVENVLAFLYHIQDEGSFSEKDETLKDSILYMGIEGVNPFNKED